MTTWQLVASTWDWEPTVVAGCATLLGGYYLIVHPLTSRVWLFGTGVLILLLALVSPLDTLGDGYLFSMHMLQHLLLILVVPPLLLVGIPRDTWARLLRWTPAGRAERMLAWPPGAWLSGMVTLWLWHLPVLYDAAVANAGIHVMQHLMFLVTATIFWWPVITPCTERRISLPATMLYLIAAACSSSVLGVIITFSPPDLYPIYQHSIDWLGIEPLIRQDWGISYALDQQLGGLIMWVTGGPVYLFWVLWAFMSWYRAPEATDRTLPVTLPLV